MMIKGLSLCSATIFVHLSFHTLQQQDPTHMLYELVWFHSPGISSIHKENLHKVNSQMMVNHHSHNRFKVLLA